MLDSDPCVFCELIKEGRYVDEFLSMVIIAPLNPTVGGHHLIVPKYHVEQLHELGPQEVHDMIISIKIVAGNNDHYVIQQSGLNAQQTIRHLHVHVVPAGGGFYIPWNRTIG